MDNEAQLLCDAAKQEEKLTYVTREYFSAKFSQMIHSKMCLLKWTHVGFHSLLHVVNVSLNPFCRISHEIALPTIH